MMQRFELPGDLHEDVKVRVQDAFGFLRFHRAYQAVGSAKYPAQWFNATAKFVHARIL